MKSPAISTDLVDRARAGDIAALEHLLSATRPSLERHARKHCASDDVDEAVQETLWVVYRKVGGLRTAAAFTAWLVQVVRRACLRKLWRHRHTLSFDELGDFDRRDSAGEDAELRADLARILCALPDPYREAILLKDVQGLSAKELGAALGLTPGAAKSRLHRARAMVRDALEGTGTKRERPAGTRRGAFASRRR